MAPFMRGARGRGGGSFRARGNSIQRGRGRGALINRGKRSTFSSTRVEELYMAESDGSHESENKSIEEKDDLIEVETSGSDEEGASEAVKPYSELLQSLNENNSSRPPPPKRRKITRDNTLPQASALENAKEFPDIPIDIDGDDIEEPEESGNLDMELLDAADKEDETETAFDAFEIHFGAADEKLLSDCIKGFTQSELTSQKVPLQPGWKALRTTYNSNSRRSGPPVRPFEQANDFQLKQKLEATSGKLLPQLEGIAGHLASTMFSYQDLLFCDRIPDIAQDLRVLMCLHTLNHVFKTRDRVIKNNARISKAGGLDDVEYRDQGFTRPKVLMLLPTRQACVKAIDTMVSLCDPEQQENRKRLQDSYVQADDNFSEDKPEDFRELFSGNDDDMFRLGMKFTRKTIKYFSQFYNSDIILASPLGLRMAIGAEDAKKQDHDFLSSIELVIADQADALLMQNWEHVDYIFEHLNLQPKETHGCDFSRVRNWYLDGNARFLRQTIIITAYNTPETNRLYGQHMLNIEGKLKVSKERYDGSMLDLGIQTKQTFSRFDAAQPVADPDARFKFFTTTIVPNLLKFSKARSGKHQGILIFVPSYMDFVRVRNFLAKSPNTQNLSFGSISEYTSVPDVARARSHFFSGRHSVLLYTGRAHHFRRYHLRGVDSVVMYALPDNPVFYKEIVGGYLTTSIAEGRVDPVETSVRSIFSKWDGLKLERVVGSKRCIAMLKERGGDTFDFL